MDLRDLVIQFKETVGSYCSLRAFQTECSFYYHKKEMSHDKSIQPQHATTCLFRASL